MPGITNQNKTPVSVAFPLNIDHTKKIILPIPWNLDATHAAISRDGYKFSSDYTASGDTLSLNYKFSYLKNFVPVDKLEQFKQDISQLEDKQLGYSITIPASWESDTETSNFNQWMLNLALLIALVLGTGGFLVYRRATPAIVFEYGGTFIPIGGWLVLVMIGLCITPVFSLVNLNNGNYFDLKTWAKMAKFTHRSAFEAHFVFEMCGHVMFLCFSVFCLVLVLKKRDILPRWIITYFAFGVVFNVANMIFANSIPNVKVPEAYLNAVIRSVVTAAIWIPYFIVSTRVKETFIVPYPSYNYSYESAEETMYKDE